MMRHPHTVAAGLLIATAAALAGCNAAPDRVDEEPGDQAEAANASATAAPVPAAVRPAVVQPAFVDEASGLALRPVPGARVGADVESGALTLGSWKLFAEPGSEGRRVVAVVLDGSNEVTTAAMRIGVSADPSSMAACLQLPAESTGPAAGQVEIGGVPFTHFRAGDAAMSHYVSADSYRAVHGGQCVAIDLLVKGTRPEVYDPPRTPPFTTEEAQQKLQALLPAVYWQR